MIVAFLSKNSVLDCVARAVVDRGCRMKKKARLVRDCMSAAPVTITSDDSLQIAQDLFRSRSVRELPVVDHGRLVGIVTDRDLREVAPSYPLFRNEDEIAMYMQKLKVAAAMTVDPLVVSPTTVLVDAARLLHTYRIGSLPVVENDRLVGIISVSDVLKLFVEQNLSEAVGKRPSRSRRTAATKPFGRMDS
jgi:acetoin utilization protein AcuB